MPCRILRLAALVLLAAPAAHAQTCTAADGHTPANRAALDAVLAPWRPADDGRRAGAPVVQAVYLVPADRDENPLVAQSLEAAVRHLRQWYSQHLPGGETFALAEPAVLTLRSTRPEAWYRQNGAQGFTTFYSNGIADALALMNRTSGDPERVWLIYPDADAGCGQCGGCGAGSATGGGFAVISANDHRGFLGGPWARVCEGDVETYGFRPCRFTGGLGHELGHAFGRPHPAGCDQGQPSCDGGALMWAGFYSYPTATFTDDDQAALAAHPFFAPATFPGPLADCDSFVAFDRPHLLDPHDGRFGFGGAAPWLIWGDRDETPQHTVQVATDDAFADVVFTHTTSDEWARFADPGVATEYRWRVRRAPSGPWSDVRRFSTVPVVAAEGGAGTGLRLAASPSPTAGPGRVSFHLDVPSDVRLSVLDVLGREVAVLADGPRAAGPHEVALNASRLAPGVYVVRLAAGRSVSSRMLSVVH